jgi:predicted N-acetyltransferase YhbS
MREESVGVLSSPELLSDNHLLEHFNCGERSLNDWLRRRARQNQSSGASRTYVVCTEPRAVIGYYCLSASTISHAAATGSIRRSMPDPVPMMLLGRLAVDITWRGKGIGAALMKDAVLRTVEVAQSVGVRGLMVHALSEDARRFYEALDFEESPADPANLMILLKDIAQTMRSTG